MPDCHLFLYDEVVAYDHLNSKIIIIVNIYNNDNIEQQYKNAEKRMDKITDKINSYFERPRNIGTTKNITVNSNVTKEEFINNVETAQKTYRCRRYFPNSFISKI